jgi:hypothetical protein
VAVCMVIFPLSITYKNWTLVDAWGKKDRHLGNKKNVTFSPSNIFDCLNVSPFSPGGFFIFLVAVAHGAPSRCALAYFVLLLCRTDERTSSGRLYSQ